MDGLDTVISSCLFVGVRLSLQAGLSDVIYKTVNHKEHKKYCIMATGTTAN